MENSQKLSLDSLSTVADACRLFDATEAEALPVHNWQNQLVGHVSDFEVRKFILNGGNFNESIAGLLSTNPVELSAPEPNIGAGIRDNLAVLMVGGAGTRLRPLTDNCPKPLLPVQGKPLLERTVEHLTWYGFRRFCFAVGYMADSIIDYFGDGSRWGVEIHYVREEKRLGTCGALRLLPEKPKETILVMNGDLITGVKYDNLLRFHQRCRARATVCVSPFEVPVPYGVVDCEGIKMTALREKPVNKYWISAGIYLLEPEAIDLIPTGGKEYDMPTLLQSIAATSESVAVYPIREKWIDIGSVDEYERANKEPLVSYAAPNALPGFESVPPASRALLS